MKFKNLIIVIAVIAVVPLQVFSAQSSESSRQWKTDRVTVTVHIQANIYTYQITNNSMFPLISFKLPYCDAYNFFVPEQWEHDTSKNLFYAHAENPVDGIMQAQKGTFSLRVSSKGAVLGNAPLELNFSDNHKLIIPEVWAPVPEPAGYRWILAGSVLAILGLQTWIVIKRRKQTSVA